MVKTKVRKMGNSEKLNRFRKLIYLAPDESSSEEFLSYTANIQSGDKAGKGIYLYLAVFQYDNYETRN